MWCNVICTHTYSIPWKQYNNHQKKKNQLEQNSCPPNLTVSDKQLQNTMALLKLKASRVSVEHTELSLQVTPTKRPPQNRTTPASQQTGSQQSVSKKSVHNAPLFMVGNHWALWSSVFYGSSWLTTDACSNGGGAKVTAPLNPKAGL